MKSVLNLALAISVMALVNGCEKTTASQQVSTSVAPVPAAPVPPPPKHLYAIQDGNEYGYESALSDAQRTQGRVASEIKMFTYLGRKGDTFQVMLRADDIRSVAECTSPCEFAKVYTFSDVTYISKEVMRLGPDAILSAVFLDAKQGHLDPVHGLQKGVVTTLGVDGDKKRLVVADAKTSGVTR